MLRSILVALDDTPGAIAARDHAFALARRTGASLTCAAVLDLPHSRDLHEAVPIGGGAFAERRNARLAEQMRQEADAALRDAQAAAGDLPLTLLALEDAPEPALLRAGMGHDLIILGRDSSLGREEAEDGLAPVIEALLQDGARPLLVVPPGPPAPAEGPVLVGYDGSIPCVRSLQLFALLGLAEASPVTVLSAAEDEAAAARLAEDGAEYLRRQGLVVDSLGVSGPPSDQLLAVVAQRAARLLVMGAFEHSGLRALLLGSATRRLLREAPCPIFVHR